MPSRAPRLDKRLTTAQAAPVGLVEIAERLGLRRQTISVWRTRHPDFPHPRWRVSGLPAWDWRRDVLPWLIATGRPTEPETASYEPVQPDDDRNQLSGISPHRRRHPPAPSCGPRGS
jgi:hypothetical protein